MFATDCTKLLNYWIVDTTLVRAHSGQKWIPSTRTMKGHAVFLERVSIPSQNNRIFSLWISPQCMNPGSPSRPNFAPKGRIGNPSKMDHPKDPATLFGRLDSQAVKITLLHVTRQSSCSFSWVSWRSSQSMKSLFRFWAPSKKIQQSGQIIMFHQPRFPWNKVISITKLPLGAHVVWRRYNLGRTILNHLFSQGLGCGPEVVNFLSLFSGKNWTKIWKRWRSLATSLPNGHFPSQQNAQKAVPLFCFWFTPRKTNMTMEKKNTVWKCISY